MNAPLEPMKKFLQLESAGGIILMIAAALAMLLANSPAAFLHQALIDTPVEVRIGALHLAKPLLLWINDGLMAVFFFLVGLELKREVLEGELSEPSKIVLPALGAVGGMAIPALIYVLFNYDDPQNISGWAIPAATDIAFALGVLSLLGDRVPASLKVFLVSLAIFDDIGAIIMIALFYSGELSTLALLVASACVIALAILNRKNIVNFAPYLLIGLILWVAVLKSGVHATLAGVLLALFIPMNDRNNPAASPLEELEHDLHSSVMLAILPLFAFANSGINLQGISLDYLLHPVPLGITLGLVIGKQIGIFGFCWLGIKLGLAKLPEGISWGSLYGVSLICGIGFTMSLFIGSLAFESGTGPALFDERLGVIVGSVISAIGGYLVLNKVLK